MVNTRPAISWNVLIFVIVALSASVLLSSRPRPRELVEASEVAARTPTGSAQLIARRFMPTPLEEMCQPEPVSAHNVFLALGQQDESDPRKNASSADVGQTADIPRPPLRMIRDTDPIYSSIALDSSSDEVLLYDANLFGIKVFSRTENTPANAKLSTPKREIGGASIAWPNNTGMQFNNGLYVDPKTGDIYSAEADTGDSIKVFPRGAQGDVKPLRSLDTPHRSYAISADEDKQELYLAVQWPPAIHVYRKTASGKDKPIRIIEGAQTKLMDIQGIAVDVKSRLIFVSNYGNYSDYTTPGTGKFYPPSITVFKLDADGDSAPVRIIQGPQTQMDWPAQLSVDPARGELYIANNVGNSLLVFREVDSGDVKPVRVIKGPKTGISNPTGVAVDLQHNEVWVSNMGNSSARVYALTAQGDVPPLRTIRSAPEGKLSLKFSKPGAVAYDSKREEVLAPN